MLAPFFSCVSSTFLVSLQLKTRGKRTKRGRGRGEKKGGAGGGRGEEKTEDKGEMVAHSLEQGERPVISEKREVKERADVVRRTRARARML